MKLVVGLGNIGKEYDGTYHNIGFRVVDSFARKFGFPAFSKNDNYFFTTLIIGQEKVMLCKPATFMNLSGNAVLKLKNFFHLDNTDIMIVLDDIDLEKGKLRFRENGSGGTHNGLKNIVELLGSTPRIRIGIGRDELLDLADYVLSKIDSVSLATITPAIDDAIDKIESWLGA